MSAIEFRRDPRTGRIVEDALVFHAGNAPGASLRIKAVRSVLGQKDATHRYATVQGALIEWSRVAVITGVQHPDGSKSYRLWVLEHGDSESEIELGQFHVRGPFRVVEQINNTRRALGAWRDFVAE